MLAVVAIALALGWHARETWDTWERSGQGRQVRDFKSYYYAVEVAAAGKDPYKTPNLHLAAVQDGVLGVHPFFYPPPFVGAMAWTRAVDVHTAYRIWFWLDEAATLLAALILGLWWRRLGTAVPVLLAIFVATMTAIPNNHLMGQVNLPVLALALGGLMAEERGRDDLGGVLVGIACMLKMSPALLVLWWLLRGRTRAVRAAVVTALVLSVAVLPLVSFDVQWRFYTEILPKFGSGEYNGLRVPIHLFGNHSLPDLANAIFPGGGHRLSTNARALSLIAISLLLGGTYWHFRVEPVDAWAAAGQISAIMVAMLLVPVYTYEHHLVWALPAMTLAAGAVVHGKLPRAWALPVLLACVALCAELSWLKTEWAEAGRTTPLAWGLREVKTAGLIVLWAATMLLGGRINR